MNKRLWIDYTKLRDKLEFLPVLQHFKIDCDGSRNQVKVACPFHEDKTPSCSINLSDSKFHCFGCGAKGNALEFVVKMEGGVVDDKNALYEGALTAIGILGLSPENFKRNATGSKTSLGESNKVKKSVSPDTAQKQCKEPKLEHTDEVTTESVPKTNQILEMSLVLDSEHPYLTKTKSLSEAVIQTFEIGYCSRGIMKNRIAIPIHNASGDLVAYAGRYASEDIPDGIARYKLPSKFHKSLELYNIHRAIEFNKRHVVLVEGYWSVFRLHMAEIPAVALMGRTISEDQAILLLESGFRFATLLLDGDEEGRKAIPEALNILGRKIYTRALELDDGVKPDTMSGESLDALR